MTIKYSDLEKMFYNIQSVIEYIEQAELQSRKYRIYLANGDIINYSMPNSSIAHLLGININYITSTKLFKNTNSFLLLKELCDNVYKINKLHQEGRINYDQMFSPYIEQKINGFNENTKLNSFETELVCKYDSSRSYVTSEKSERYDYVIIKKYSDGKIGLLCLVKKENIFVPMSNQLFNNFEEAKESIKNLVSNQAITLITGINSYNDISTYNKNFNLNLDTKLEKINNMKYYKDEFNAIIDIAEDYEYSIGKLQKNKKNHFEDNDLINTIVSNIKNGKLIDIDLFRDTNLSPIIDAFNDFLCNNQVTSNDSASTAYSKIKADLLKLKQDLITSNSQNETLKDENNLLKDNNTILNEENSKYKKNEEAIINILKPRI